LPLSSPSAAWLVCCLTTATLLATMARDLSFFDSPLLSMAAVQLGLAHPPGQPLHTLLGALFARLSPWSPLLGLNALSALAGGLTVLPALSLAEGMVASDAAQPSRGARILMGSVVFLGAQHAVVWEQSTRVEVYALAALLCTWCLARLSFLLSLAGSRAQPFLGLGLGLGLAASTNPVLALIALFAAAPAALAKLVRRSLGVDKVLWIGVGGLLGLVPYAYVPWVATRTSALRWGAPSTREALIHYFSGRDFSSNLTVSGGRWVNQLLTWFSWSYESALLPVLALGSVAQLVAPMRGLGRFVALLATILSASYLARYVHFKPDVPDHISYASLAMWLCAAAIAGLCAVLYERGQRVISVALVGIPLTCALLSPPGMLTRTRSGDETARHLAQELLRGAPPNAILLLSSDHWAVPTMYLQEVERVRPDVMLLATGLLSSSWHWDRIYQAHPDAAKIAMAGAGGRLGRARRFLDAHASRPVLLEERELASALGLAPCVDGLMLLARAPCDPKRQKHADDLIATLTSRVGDGEPTSLGVLSYVSAGVGEAAWRRGDAERAVRAFLAGVPRSWEIDRSPLSAAPRAPALTVPLPVWQRDVPLGDPARNAYLAGQITLAAGDPKTGIALISVAARHGLPEAAEWLAQMQQVAN
jgi:hypothetical protein